MTDLLARYLEVYTEFRDLYFWPSNYWDSPSMLEAVRIGNLSCVVSFFLGVNFQLASLGYSPGSR